MEANDIDPDILLAIQLSLQQGAAPDEDPPPAEIENEPAPSVAEEPASKASVEEKNEYFVLLTEALQGEDAFKTAADLEKTFKPLLRYLECKSDGIISSTDSFTFLTHVLDVLLLSLYDLSEFSTIFNVDEQRAFFRNLYTASLSFCLRGIEKTTEALISFSKGQPTGPCSAFEEDTLYDLRAQLFGIINNCCVTDFLPTKTSLTRRKKAISSLHIPCTKLQVTDLVPEVSTVEEEVVDSSKDFLQLLLSAKPSLSSPVVVVKQAPETIVRSKLMKMNILTLDTLEGFTRILSSVTTLTSNVKLLDNAKNLDYIQSVIKFMHSKGIHTNYEPGLQSELLAKEMVLLTVSLLQCDCKPAISSSIYEKSFQLIQRLGSVGLSINVQCWVAKTILERNDISEYLDTLIDTKIKPISSNVSVNFSLCDLAFGIYKQVLLTDIQLSNSIFTGSADTGSFDCYHNHSLEELQGYLLEIPLLDSLFAFFMQSYKASCMNEYLAPTASLSESVEILSNLFSTPPPQPKNSNSSQKKKKSSSKTSSSSTSSKKEPEVPSYTHATFMVSVSSFLMELCQTTNQLVKSTLSMTVLESHIDCIQLYAAYQSPKTKHTITDGNISKDCVGPLLCITEVTANMNCVIYSLIVNEIISTANQQYILNTADDKWPLFIPSIKLTLQSRTLLNQFSAGKNTAQIIWQKFLVSLEQYINESYISPVTQDILGPEHCQFLLMAFHFITDKQKRVDIFTKLCSLLKSECESDKPRNLLILSRLIIIVQYFLFHFDAPSSTLQENFEEILLGQVDGCYFENKPSNIDSYNEPTLYHLKKPNKDMSPDTESIFTASADGPDGLFRLYSKLLLVSSNESLGSTTTIYEYYFQQAWFFLKNISQSNDTLLCQYNDTKDRNIDNGLTHYLYSLARLTLDRIGETESPIIDFKSHIKAICSLIKRLAKSQDKSCLTIPIGQASIEFLGLSLQSTIDFTKKEGEEENFQNYFKAAVENSTAYQCSQQVTEFLKTDMNHVISLLVFSFDHISSEFNKARKEALCVDADIAKSYDFIEALQRGIVPSDDLRSILEQFLASSSASLVLEWNKVPSSESGGIYTNIPSERVEQTILNYISCNEILVSLNGFAASLVDLFGIVIAILRDSDSNLFEGQIAKDLVIALLGLSSTPLLDSSIAFTMLSNIVDDDTISNNQILNQFNDINTVFSAVDSTSNIHSAAINSVTGLYLSIIQNHAVSLDSQGKLDSIPLKELLSMFITSTNDKVITSLYELFTMLLNCEDSSPLTKVKSQLINFITEASDEDTRKWLTQQILGREIESKHTPSCKTIVDTTVKFINALLVFRSSDLEKKIVSNCVAIFDIAFYNWIDNVESYFTLLQNMCWQTNMVAELVGKIASFLLEDSVLAKIKSSPPHMKCTTLLIQFLHESLQLVSPELTSKSLATPSTDDTHTKLCTFTETKEEFTLQHWYNCYTCGLTFSEGVCSVCVKVCHKGHDVSYAYRSNFFCDCGAGAAPGITCSALVPRAKEVIVSENPLTVSTELKLLDTPAKDNLTMYLKKGSFGEHLIGIYKNLLGVLQSKTPSVKELAKVNISMNEKKISTKSDIISFKRGMKPTFNVKYDYEGNYGKQLKNLVKKKAITRHLLDISSLGFIIIAENNSVTIGSVDKLFESGKGSISKKHFNVISSSSLTFHPLYISVNSSNPHYVAVAGIKDCTILTLDDSGKVTDQLAVNLSMEALADNLHLVNVMWIPGSQVKLAIITNQYVKVFDLSKDSMCPIHYFTLLEDDVQDVSFYIRKDDGKTFMLLLATSSMLFCQELDEEQGGPCIMTDVVQIDQCLTGKGGYSVHYSDILELTIVSFADGTAFAGRLDPKTHSSFLWTFRLNTPENTDSYHSWVDIPSHPGSIVCRSSSESIIAMFINKDDLSVQILPLSDKIEGIAHVPDCFTSQSMICTIVGDGSINRLNFPSASESDSTDTELPDEKVELKKKLDKLRLLALFKEKLKLDPKVEAAIPSPAPKKVDFPVDFFEKVDIITDTIEIKGDVLTCYTNESAKSQLKSPSGYLVLPNSSKFEIICENTQSHMAICGVRVLVGAASTEHIPKSISVLGRTIKCIEGNRRWYEFPLTDSDSIRAQDKISIIANDSYDSSNSIVIDSIEVYGLPLDQFDLKTNNSSKAAIGALETSIQLCTDILSGYYKNFVPESAILNVEELLSFFPALLKKEDSGLYRSLDRFMRVLIKDEDMYNNMKDSSLLCFIADTFESQTIVKAEKYSKYIEIMSEATSKRSQNMFQVFEHYPGVVKALVTNFWRIYTSSECWELVDEIIFSLMDILYGFSKYLKFCAQSPLAPAFSLLKEFICSSDELIRVYSVNAISKFFIKEGSSDAATVSVFYTCDGCSQLIKESRWHCDECEDYDLCNECRNTFENLPPSNHTQSHSMTEIQQESNGDAPAASSSDISNDIDPEDEEALLEAALAMSLNWGENRKASLENQVQDDLFSWLLDEYKSLSQQGGCKLIPIARLLYSLCLFNKDSDAWMTNTISKVISTTCPITQQIERRTPEMEADILTLKLLAALIRDPRGKNVVDYIELVPSEASASVTITLLKETNIVNQLYNIVESIFPLLVDNVTEEVPISSSGALLQPSKRTSQDHLFPFFSKRYIHDNSDLFTNHRELLVESVLKLATLLYKGNCIDTSINWKPLLCKYINAPQTAFITKKAKSLLLAVCKSKKAYYLERDFAQFKESWDTITHLSEISSEFREELKYTSVVDLMRCLNTTWQTAFSRPLNWQAFVHQYDNVLTLLFNSSFYFTEEPLIITLQLLAYSFLPKPLLAEKIPPKKLERMDVESCSTFSKETLDTLCSNNILSRFLNVYLLEYNSASVRAEARNVFHLMWFQASNELKEMIFKLLCDKIPLVPSYGRNGAEFFELIAFVIDDKEEVSNDVFSTLLKTLQQQNNLLCHHPNSYLYETLSGLVNFDGYYLESEPCLVCNDPEVPFTEKSLSNIVSETKFTANTIINKFTDSYTIQKFTMVMSEVRKSRMVKTVNIYYNNKTVQDIAELRDQWKMWKKVKSCNLTEGQRTLTVDFLIPITATNFLIEFADFYENLQIKAMEKLQCPRCSQVVTDKHGICNNCRENAYQCGQCRNINYEDLTAFLCNECGYCSYANFGYSLKSKVSFTTDRIENDEERNAAMEIVDKESAAAYDCYTEIMANKKPINNLILQIKSDVSPDENHNNDSLVNPKIYQLANSYNGTCKSVFASLSKSMQILLGTRRELVRYNNRSLCKPEVVDAKKRPENQCYGCANAFISLSLSLIENLSNKTTIQAKIVKCGVLTELIATNLLQGTSENRAETRKVICSLVKNGVNATRLVNDFLWKKFDYALENYKRIDLAGFIKNEVQLLVDTAAITDSCWESRLQLLMKVFFIATKYDSSPVIVNQLVLPCLRHIASLSTPPSVEDTLVKVLPSEGYPSVEYSSWCDTALYNTWKSSAEITNTSGYEEINYLVIRKYLAHWQRVAGVTSNTNELNLGDSWIIDLLFCSTSISVREEAAHLIQQLSTTFTRKLAFLRLLTSKLEQAITAGDTATEYFDLFEIMIEETEFKVYLTLRGFLKTISDLILKEIERIQSLESTFTSDISQGYVLQTYISILDSFLEVPGIKRKFKEDQLMITLLDGFLSLRGVIVQKTKLTDDSADKLISLLKSLHGSNEEDNQLFMVACIKALDKHSTGRTPIFIFEQLCNIVCPTKPKPEFLLCLNKSATQEEFIRGSMTKNPYPSKETGPLMRDVKNKICRDLDLRGLLEDDNSMELLVCDKIIKLDLTVQQVFEQVWMKETNADSVETAKPMDITYRLQGLDGEATEDIVESLPDDTDEEVDPEEKYKITSIMSTCGGLEASIKILERITDFDVDRELAYKVLNLLVHCCKIKLNRQKLIELHSVSVFLDKLSLSFPQESQADIAELLLLIVESIVSEANTSGESQSADEDIIRTEDSEEAKSQMSMFLDKLGSPLVRCNPRIVKSVTRVLPVLTHGQEDIAQLLALFFVPYLTFDEYDSNEFDDSTFVFHLDCFVRVASSIRQDSNGMQLRDVFNSQGITQQLYDYLCSKMPNETPSEAEESWKVFTEYKSLEYVLPALSGLTRGHKTTQQIAIDRNVLGGLYQLSCMSTANKLGNLAEGLLESLSLNNLDVAATIDKITTTNEEKKKEIAQVARDRILGQLNMKVDPSDTETGGIGKITVTDFDCFEDLEDEIFSCKVCREGFVYMPEEVLGVYVFSKKVALGTSRKDSGYSTVTNFNIIHVSCHRKAAEADAALKPRKEEWEGAMLRNSSTLCNNIFPVRGPAITDDVYACQVDYYWSNLSDNCGHCDTPRFRLLAHDFKSLLLRFANQLSLSEDSKGGGRESNISMVPFLIQMGMFILDQPGSPQRTTYEQALSQFLSADKSLWTKACGKPDNTYYCLVLSIFLQSKEEWNHWKPYFLHRILYQAFTDTSSNEKELSDEQLFTKCQPSLAFFVLIDFINQQLKSSSSAVLSTDTSFSHKSDADWIVSLNKLITETPVDVIDTAKAILFNFADVIKATELQPFYESLALTSTHPVASEHAKSIFTEYITQ